ncbi:MAG: helix-turn-helix transcriptional regulator [Deltaproteobacteria bacterium]|nr:helix-turn-helix transcriptional regulator [Deltaproteobacteria bacterium]
MNAQNIFGSRLRRLRKSKKLKAKDLSKVFYCSPSLIYNIEKGYNEPQPDFIVRVAAFFDVTTDFLLGTEQQRALPSDKEITNLYRRLNQESKMIIFDLLRLLGNFCKNG